MLFGIQLLGIFFVLVMIYFSYLFYKKKTYNLRSLLLWVGIWIAFLILVMFPTVIYGIMSSLQIERTVDFFAVSGLLVFAVILFYLYGIVKKIETNMEDLVRKIAIKKVKKGKKK